MSWMTEVFAHVRDEALNYLEAATEEDLWTVRDTNARELSKDSYLRMIVHTDVHVRWIWQLRGALGLSHRAQQRWPR